MHIEPTHLDDIERFVEDDLLPFAERLRFDGGMKTDLHLTAGYVDIPRAIGIEAGENAVGRGRSGQLLHFSPQRFDLRFGFLKSGDELFVLLRRLFELIA